MAREARVATEIEVRGGANRRNCRAKQPSTRPTFALAVGVRGCYETQFVVASVEQTIRKQSAAGVCMTAQHAAEGEVLGSSGRNSPSPTGTAEFRNSLVSPRSKCDKRSRAELSPIAR